jgi:adenine-specific DNA-methyltransferase
LKSIELFVNHIIQGDCVQIMQSMPSESVDLVLTDPPYLVRYKARDGRRCLDDDNAAWLRPAFHQLYRLLKPDRFCISFYGWPWIDQFMAAWKEAGFRPVSHLIWVKKHCSREGYTRSHHEVGFLLAKGRPARPPEPSSDVLPWQYTGNKFHPNEKPVVGLIPLITAYSKEGDIVLDPFAGSGTTAIAAKAYNRKFILIEKACAVFQIATRRLNP